MSDVMRFDGKVVVITGAGRGLGRTYAEQFAARGASVVVNDWGGAGDGTGEGSSEPAREVVAAITDAGGRAVADPGDVSDPASAAALIDLAVESFGRVDVVVNNAGISYTFAPFIETSIESFRRYMRVNLEGSFLVTQAAWPHLIASGAGRVIMTTSTAGYFGFPGQLPYGVSKMGTVGLIRGLSIEGKAHGIRVNGVAPSAYTRLVERVVDLSPNPRIGAWMRTLDPALVAPLVLYLGHESCTVSGNDYDTAGGRVSRLMGTSETVGVISRSLTPEVVRDRIEEIHDESAHVTLATGRNHLGLLQELLPLEG